MLLCEASAGFEGALAFGLGCTDFVDCALNGGVALLDYALRLLLRLAENGVALFAKFVGVGLVAFE